MPRELPYTPWGFVAGDITISLSCAYVLFGVPDDGSISTGKVNEDAGHRFQQLSGSVHKMGMVLDSVQTDVIQLNRTIKDASVESGGVQQKFDLLEDTLQKIIKGQNDLKVLAENSMKSNSDQLNVLNSRTSKLNEMSLVVSVCPKKVQADLRELHGDTFRVLTKDMEELS
ncbi:protein PAIR1-like [Triticum dicoccoides]|uniref:protein PAIR1-like n=1 Tax=Triticum dicoccoides TaxID=85692 RepID=UPI001891128A|nr:protein PAIR1-like [Triticum dicoccoides]